MLVTVSGMVGSGKSTTAARINALLQARGHARTDIWNFRTLPCFQWGRPLKRPAEPATRDAASTSNRGTGYRRRRLSLLHAAGYAMRMLLFRAYAWQKGPGPHVCNRYFYDNLTHFALRTPFERLWLRLLRGLMPRPDLAVMVIASPDIIRARRPTYSDDYLEAVWHAYDALPSRFPELVVVSTDGHDDTNATLVRLIERLL